MQSSTGKETQEEERRKGEKGRERKKGAEIKLCQHCNGLYHLHVQTDLHRVDKEDQPREMIDGCKGP